MPAVPAIIGVAGALGSAKMQGDAAKKAARAGRAAQINPDEVAGKARTQARQNLLDSLAMERELLPEQQALRNQSLTALLGQVGGDKYIQQAMQEVAAQMGLTPEQAQRSQLLQDAVAKAGADLALGGSLDTETQNAVTRAGLARAAGVGGGNMGTARAIVPRDLGLTSLQLQQQRLANAGHFGQMDQAMNQQDFANAMANRGQQANLATNLANLANSDFSRYMQLANFGQSLQAPVAGLDPGQYATLYLQNATNMAQSGANAAALQAARASNTANMMGQIAGQDWGSIIKGVSGLFNKPSTPGTTIGATSPGSGWTSFDTGMGGSWGTGWQPK